MRYIAEIVSISLLVAAAPVIAQDRNDGPPAPPAGSAPTLVLPPVDQDGTFDTPNHHLTPAEEVWHLRAALNVAALDCRGRGEDAIVNGYNHMLTQHAAGLSAAASRMEASYHARYGIRWEVAREHDMTKTYNFFALPPVQSEFCAIAAAVLTEIADVDDRDLPEFADARLRLLEAPFQNFYARYAAYRVALNSWRENRSTVAVAAVTALPSTPQDDGR